MKTINLVKPIVINYEALGEVVTYEQVSCTTYTDGVLALIVGNEYDYVSVSTNISNFGKDIIAVNSTNEHEYYCAEKLVDQKILIRTNLPNASSGFNRNAYVKYRVNLEMFDKGE